MPRVTISEPGKTPQPYRFKLERKLIKIGRGSDNDIVISCSSASTKHCVMERVEGGYVLRDKNSTNGIKHSSTLMDVIDLFDGMEVLIGDVPFKFQLSDEEIETLAKEDFTSHERKKLPPVDQEDAQAARHATTSSPRASHHHRAQPTVQQSGGFLKTIAIFSLILLAIFAGMTLRHSMRTGEFLPSKLMGNNADNKDPQNATTPAAETEQPAEDASGESEDDSAE